VRTHWLSGFVAGVTLLAVEALIASTTSLSLPTQAGARPVTELAVAKNALAHAFPCDAVNRLTAFVGEVEVQRGTRLSDQQADRLIGRPRRSSAVCNRRA
jgi:hypothetical protein